MINGKIFRLTEIRFEKPDHNWTIGEMAKIVDLSQPYFQRLFNLHKVRTVAQFLSSLISLLMLLALLAPGSLAQTIPTSQVTKEQAEQQFRKWQTRVDDLTKEIVSESSAVSDSERAMYLALLAKMWWKIDQTEARVYLRKAADKMLSGLRSDDKSDIAKKVKFSQEAIEIITKLDEKFALDLVGHIEAAVDGGDDANRKENPELAELFAGLGLQIVEKNPTIAMACGFDSLIYGVASNLPRLISELNIQDPGKAELLFRRAMAKVQGNYSTPRLLFLHNFAKYLFDIRGENAFSESIRRAFLNTYADRVAAAAIVGPERPTRCRIAYYAPHVLSRIDEYLPGQSLTFRQNIQTCIPYLASVVQEMTRAQASADQPKTPEEFVRAAKDTSDLELKVRYWRGALSLLEKEKKYAETISLLDATDGDDYKAVSPIGWDNWRIGAVYESAMVSFEAKDLPAAYRVIERTPKRIRPEVRMRLAKKLKPAGDNQFYMENLDELQKELGSIEQAAVDAASYYKVLAELYLKVRPTESEAMFRKAVKYINKTDDDNPDFLNDKDWAPFSDYVPMTCELLEVDEQSIISSLNNLSSRRSRVRLKLGLLESSLKKYVEAKKTLDDLNRSKKTESNKPTKSIGAAPKP